MTVDKQTLLSYVGGYVAVTTKDGTFHGQLVAVYEGEVGIFPGDIVLRYDDDTVDTFTFGEVLDVRDWVS